MLKIKRIGVLSVAKIFGVLYAIVGLLAGIVFAMMSSFASLLATQAGEEAFGNMIGALFGIGSIIYLPIIYGIMGFIGGAFMAFLYNLVAGISGGIEIETE